MAKVSSPYGALLKTLGLHRRPGRAEALRLCDDALREALTHPTWGSNAHVPQALYAQMFAKPEVGLSLSLSFWGATLRDVLKRAISVGKSATAALDIGCGAGALSCLLALACPGLRVVGVDRCEAAIRAAHWLAGRLGVLERASFVCDDLNTWATDARFDLFTSTGGLLPAANAMEADLWDASQSPFFSTAALAPPPARRAARLRRLQALAARVRTWATPRAAWVMCERLGTIPGAMYFLQTLHDAGWGANWNRSGWGAAGADDAARWLPLWVLRADFQGPSWSERSHYVLDIWRKHPDRRHWRGEGWALHAEAEQRLLCWPGRAQVWGVALWIEGFGRLRLELWQDNTGRLLYYQTHEGGARQLLWNQDGVEALRRFFQNLSRSFNVEALYDPTTDAYERLASQDEAHALGAWLFEGLPPVTGTADRRTAFAGRGRPAVLSRLTGEAFEATFQHHDLIQAQ